jgi:hypothetical protein
MKFTEEHVRLLLIGGESLLADYDYAKLLVVFEELWNFGGTVSEFFADIRRKPLISLIDCELIRQRQPVRNTDWVRIFSDDIPGHFPRFQKQSLEIARGLFALFYIEQAYADSKVSVQRDLGPLKLLLIGK